MNQKSIELLSSEELENVTGGEGVKDFFLGLADPVRNYIPKVGEGSFGKFDKDKKAESIGRAVSSTALIASLATTVVYGTYKLTGVLRSKLGQEAEDADTTTA